MSASDTGVITVNCGKHHRGLFKASKRLSLNKYDTKLISRYSAQREEKVRSTSVRGFTRDSRLPGGHYQYF
jgi:hypothetical protein